MSTEDDFDTKARNILKEIKGAKSILLHCHPSPDPDSVGSASAMRFALEQLGKKATVIRGDSEIPRGFLHFPGVSEIIQKNFFEIDIAKFDLFIVLDSSLTGISRLKDVNLPASLKVVNIDHHRTNTGDGSTTVIDTSSPATAFIIYRLLKLWNINITPDIAVNLFIGMYTDTGGFSYEATNYHVLQAAADLAKIAPDYTKALFIMQNSQEKESLYAQALALNTIQTFCDDNIALSAIPLASLNEKNISPEFISEGHIANLLKSVIGWNIGISMVEVESRKVKVSFRTRDALKYDVSKLALELGGGGHQAAAGATHAMSLDEAVKKVVETAKILYNL